ncbi:MAG: CapA family protein [Ruminococcaceae bacterium]|nr:CapA family protein [Oscillospiraceae bacterium]
MKKITFLGDIMCEPSMLTPNKQADGSYNFDDTFVKLKPMLAEADYVIGNMEFPLAGQEATYSPTFFTFNAPDSYADTIKNMGVDLVSIVNNHTLDRGVDGMMRTMRVLDEKGLDRVGTHLPEEERKEAFYFTLDGVKYAVIAYTYTTNKVLKDDDVKYEQYINYLRKPSMSAYTPEIRKKMKTWVDKLPYIKKLKEQQRAKIKRFFGMPGTVERADDNMETDCFSPYIDNFVADIKKAKENSDFVICFPHIGGQFNRKTGLFSEFVIKHALDAGADAIFAHHSHMVQKAEYVGNVPVAYSLGNVTMCPYAATIIKEHLPDYGLVAHLYMNGNKIEKTTFSIIKGVQKKGDKLVSWPVDELYKSLTKEKDKKKLEKDVRQVYMYAMGKDIEGEVFRKEYEL